MGVALDCRLGLRSTLTLHNRFALGHVESVAYLRSWVTESALPREHSPIGRTISDTTQGTALRELPAVRNSQVAGWEPTFQLPCDSLSVTPEVLSYVRTGFGMAFYRFTLETELANVLTLEDTEGLALVGIVRLLSCHSVSTRATELGRQSVPLRKGTALCFTRGW